jgi:hypothetical protein
MAQKPRPPPVIGPCPRGPVPSNPGIEIPPFLSPCLHAEVLAFRHAGVSSESLVVRGNSRPRLLQFVQPFFDLTQLFSKKIRITFEHLNFLLLGRRPPWRRWWTVPPRTPAPTSPETIGMISPSSRSHSVRHINPSFRDVVRGK